MKARNHTLLSSNTTSKECKAWDGFMRSKCLFGSLRAPPVYHFFHLYHFLLLNCKSMWMLKIVFACFFDIFCYVARGKPVSSFMWQNSMIYDLLQEMCTLQAYTCFHFCDALLVQSVTYMAPNLWCCYSQQAILLLALNQLPICTLKLVSIAHFSLLHLFVLGLLESSNRHEAYKTFKNCVIIACPFKVC